MNNIKTILMIFSLVLMYSFISAQGNCQGGNIKVFKGASGCGCHCQKECVTAAELPTYLANGWNTNGCWNCCKLKNWVDASDESTIQGVVPAKEEIVTIDVLDMTGRFVETVEYVETEDHELIWDKTGLTPGMYILSVKSGSYSENQIVSVGN